LPRPATSHHGRTKPDSKPQAAQQALKADDRPKAQRKFKPGTWDKATALLAELAERFPKTFGKKYVPLAKGIYHDVRAATDASGAVVNCALARRCHSIAYNKAMINPGAERLELGGRLVEPVSDEDQAFARSKLEIRLRHQKQRRAQKYIKERSRNR
jgi:ProP effector